MVACGYRRNCGTRYDRENLDIDARIRQLGDALERRFGTLGRLLLDFILASPFFILGYLLLSPMMFLGAVLISALMGVFVFSLFDMWPDNWRQMRFLEHVRLALMVVSGFMGLVAVGYALFVMGLWPLWVLQ